MKDEAKLELKDLFGDVLEVHFNYDDHEDFWFSVGEGEVVLNTKQAIALRDFLNQNLEGF